ncbi:hypothetical protein EJB05_46229, partial [Eragrostis curvula]
MDPFLMICYLCTYNSVSQPEAVRVRRRRVDAAKALSVIACAAAALALFAMTVDPANSRFLGPCAPTDEEAADLRAASKLLLLAAAAQLIGATTARYAAALPFTISACALAIPTAFHGYDVLRMVVGCDRHLHDDGGELAAHFWVVIALLGAAIFVVMLDAFWGCCI